METKAKRAAAEKVRRRFTNEISPLGFRRTRSTFWTRSQEHVVEFIHLHMFTFAPAFRVHFGIRVLNDSFGAAALNGPASSNAEAFGFGADEASFSACAVAMSDYCHSEGESWFGRYRDLSLLLDEGSPLKRDERLALEESIAGGAAVERVHASKELLGVV